MKSLFALTFAAVTAFALPSQAAFITDGEYKISNNEYHSLGDAGFYRKNDAGSYDLYDFNSNGADVTLAYDSTAGTINLGGKAYDTVGNRLVDFDLNYTGVGERGTNSTYTKDVTILGTFDGVEVMGKGNREGASLNITRPEDLVQNLVALNGHAWLGTDAGHFGDFHFTGLAQASSSGGGSVPAPGGIAFLMLGALALRRMKK